MPVSQSWSLAGSHTSVGWSANSSEPCCSSPQRVGRGVTPRPVPLVDLWRQNQAASKVASRPSGAKVTVTVSAWRLAPAIVISGRELMSKVRWPASRWRPVVMLSLSQVPRYRWVVPSSKRTSSQSRSCPTATIPMSTPLFRPRLVYTMLRSCRRRMSWPASASGAQEALDRCNRLLDLGVAGRVALLDSVADAVADVFVEQADADAL